MMFFRGRTPSHIFALALLLAASAQAQHDVPLTLAEAEDRALAGEPGHAAFLARAAAFGERAVVAGQLPDPTMRIGLANYPISSGGFSTEAMTQAQLGFRQSFPSGKSREFSLQRYESLALEMNQNAAARSRDVLTRVRNAWLETYYWQHAHDVVTESRPFFMDLAEISRSLYSVGRKTQQDVLRAELELRRLDDRLIEIDRRHAQAVAALSEWLGADARRPVAAKLPMWDRLPARESLRASLSSHPAVLAADARVAASSAGVHVAEERKKPGWALDLGYGYREGELANGEPRSDFVSVSVTMDMPLFRKNRQDRSLAAALSERSAAEFERHDLLRRLSSQLDAEYALWQDISLRVVLYETSILGLSASHAQAALLAYQSEAGDFADVMRGFIDDLNTRLDHVRLQVERAQSYAVLANLGGLPR
ncbi:MAG: TolC family protein [Gammaproteobacteria bacterium]|nr:TolC family protein [Gammaproteobacteria bacterium]